MSEPTSAPGSSGGETDESPETAAEDHEAAMMRKVMRMQKRHREGGVDPELDDPGADDAPGA